MRRIALLTIAVGLFVSSSVAPSHATVYQSFISSTGNDANSCSRTCPCLTLAGAIANTQPGGEVKCIDVPGPLGNPVTIPQSVEINCSGVEATFFHGAAPGIVINLNTNDVLQTVRLRGLSLNGAFVGARGISIVAAKTVILENMEITAEVGQGIADVRTTGGLLVIKNSLIAKTVGAGIAIAATGGPHGATLENLRSFSNGFGLDVGSGNSVMVIGSALSGNSVSGVEIDSGGQVALNNSIVNFNPTGLQNSGFLTLTGSTISFNNTAVIGPSMSFGDNRIFGNSSPGTAPTLGAASTDHSKQ